jgi:hypothetical protein
MRTITNHLTQRRKGAEKITIGFPLRLCASA